MFIAPLAGALKALGLLGSRTVRANRLDGEGWLLVTRGGEGHGSYMETLRRAFRRLPFGQRRGPEANIGQRLVSGVSWTILGNLAWRGFTVAASVVTARLLGKAAFGEFAMVRSTVDVFSVFASFRLGATVAKYVAEFKHKDPRKAAMVLKLTLSAAMALCVVAAVVCAATAGLVADRLLKHPEMSASLALGSVFLFFSVYGLVNETALSGFEDFRSIAAVNFWKGLSTVVLSIPAVWFWGVKGAVVALAVSAALALCNSSLYLRREAARAGFPRDIPWSELKGELPILWRFTLPLTIDGFLISATMWLGRAVIARQAGGTAELGLFGAADQWRTGILFLPTVLGRVVLPILAETHSRSPKDEFPRALALQVETFWLIALPATVAIIALADPLSAVFGRDYAGSAKIMRVLMLSVFFYCVNTAERQALAATNRAWQCLTLDVVWAAMLIGSSLWLVPKYGALGFANANLLAYAALVVLQMIHTNLVVAKGILFEHLGFYSYALALLLATYLSQRGTGHQAHALHAVLTALAILPIARKLLHNRDSLRWRCRIGAQGAIRRGEISHDEQR